jgi:hypothetical protein
MLQVGCTPLHFAAEHEHDNIVGLLLLAKASANAATHVRPSGAVGQCDVVWGYCRYRMAGIVP